MVTAVGILGKNFFKVLFVPVTLNVRIPVFMKLSVCLVAIDIQHF